MGTSIHPSVVIMPGATIGEGTRIGAFTVVGSMARIGVNCDIGSHCEIGVQQGVLPEGPLSIGDGALIRSGSVFYQNSQFGPGLKTGHRVVVREGIRALEDLQIGTMSDLQGHSTIGASVRIHSKVFVAQQTIIGSFVWLYSYVALTNDLRPPSDLVDGCVVEDFAVIAVRATVLPGRRIRRGALVGAAALVTNDVPEDTICVGVPGRNIGHTSSILLKSDGKAAYPWRRHFHRGYPEHVVAQWKREFA